VANSAFWGGRAGLCDRALSGFWSPSRRGSIASQRSASCEWRALGICRRPELRRTRESSRRSLSPRDLGLNFGERQGAAAPDKPLGRDLLLRVDFGDLHGTVALSEPMGDAAVTKDAGAH
jgi:hypothetical protein